VSRSTTHHIMRLIVLVISIVIIGADLTPVSAQNANSSPTAPPEDTSMQNDNMSNMNMNRGGRRRRGRRRRGGTMNTGTTAVDTTVTPGQEVVTDRPVQMPVRTGRCDPNTQEQTDLSGTYTGTVNYAEGGLSGDTTLTITGNDFTMTSGSSTLEGRVVAVTTCNYTAVTMMFGKGQTTATSGPQPAALPAVSLRARRTGGGGGLSLASVPGERREFSFTSAGTGGGPRGRRGRRRTPPPPPPSTMDHAH
jgi:hypothetical protein